MCSPLLSLPRELTLLLLEYLDPPSLAALESTARSVKQAMGERWKNQAYKNVYTRIRNRENSTTILRALRLLREKAKQGGELCMPGRYEIDSSKHMFADCNCCCSFTTSPCKRYILWLFIDACTGRNYNKCVEAEREHLLSLGAKKIIELTNHHISHIKAEMLRAYMRNYDMSARDLERFKSKVM